MSGFPIYFYRDTRVESVASGGPGSFILYPLADGPVDVPGGSRVWAEVDEERGVSRIVRVEPAGEG